jgi:hypothetical protein
VFFATSLVSLTVFLRPPIITREYVFAIGVIIVATVTSAYETLRVFSEKAL